MSQPAFTLSGIGLITGKPSTVEILQTPPGSGIVFEVDGTIIPAKPQSVVNADRGVTLGAEGKTLSIVEHFLSACAMTGHTDLHVQVLGAPELPLLDGSALPWLNALQEHFGKSPALPVTNNFTLSAPVVYQDPRHASIQLQALPAETLQITYLVDFPHPDLQNRWFTWSAATENLVDTIAPARTFGAVSELPLLQAQGLALGVSVENTLGLTDDGGYTSELRFPLEPIRHKILDLIGDLMLCGIPIQQLKAHIIVSWGGHAAHLAFGQLLAKSIKPVSDTVLSH